MDRSAIQAIWHLRRFAMNKGDSVKRASTSRSARMLPRIASAIILGLFLAKPSFAVDRTTQFVEGLRQRGWNDVVLEYLDTANLDPIATQEFLDRLDYERATTFAAMAKAAVRESERIEFKTRAIDRFQEFATNHPDFPQYLDAVSQSATLLSEQAQSLLAKADRLPSAATSQRDALLTKSRETFDAAGAAIEAILAACSRELGEGNIIEPDREQQLIVKQAETRFLAATLLFDKAKAYKVGSKEGTKTLEAAVKAFAALHKDYADKLVGFYGRLYEGRANQALGKWSDALECYGDLVDQPISAPDFRRILARAYRYRAECHFANGGVDTAIEECRDWLSDAQGDELEDADWLAVAFRLAEACERKASTSEGTAATKLRSEAKQLFREIATRPGEFQIAARTAIDADTANTVASKDVKSFSEAFTAGKESLERMNSTKLAARLAEENNPDSVANLRQQADQNQADARRFLETALRLADEDAKLEELLAARHYLCWIYWEEGRVVDAAVIGEFIARRYPESTFASSAAKVALAAWENMYLAAKRSGEETTYESENLSSVAGLIAKLWPESPEAGTAVNLLMQIALSDNRLEDAEAMLGQLPETSRASAKLNLGGALWVRRLQQIGNDPNAGAELKARAEELLSSGYEELSDKSPLNPLVAAGVLYYAQSLNAAGNADRALTVLENPSVGPLAIVEGGQLELQPAFVFETYKAALRSYLLADPPQLEKVERMMTALEKAAGSTDDGQKQLTRTYLALGLELQRLIRSLHDDGKRDQAEGLFAPLQALLEKLSSGDGEGGWEVRNWIAQTHLQMGQELQDTAAQEHLTKAENVFQSMLDEAAKDAAFAPNQLAVLGVRKQLGDVMRAQVRYDAAYKQYVGILREKPNMLDMQQEAARILQEWGVAEKKSDKLEAAIHGAELQQDKKNLVWGWLRLATIASHTAQQAKAKSDSERFEKFHELFFETRYHVAECRLQVALISTEATRTQQLNAARQNVESMQRLYPDLGGPKWRQQFDELLVKIKEASSD